MEHSQQNISQPNSNVSIVSDTHTTTSPVTTLSVVECLTTSGGVVTSISGQHVSTVTTSEFIIILYLNESFYVPIHSYIAIVKPQ